MELDSKLDVKMSYIGGAKSDTGVKTEGWNSVGGLWKQNAKSDPGVSMGKPSEGVQEETEAEMKEQEAVEEMMQGQFEYSPEKPMGNHGHEHDHCATTTVKTTETITTTTTTTLPTPKCSSSAAMDQGLKGKGSTSTAVPCQAYESEN